MGGSEAVVGLFERLMFSFDWALSALDDSVID